MSGPLTGSSRKTLAIRARWFVAAVNIGTKNDRLNLYINAQTYL